MAKQNEPLTMQAARMSRRTLIIVTVVTVIAGFAYVLLTAWLQPRPTFSPKKAKNPVEDIINRHAEIARRDSDFKSNITHFKATLVQRTYVNHSEGLVINNNGKISAINNGNVIYNINRSDFRK